MCSKKSRYVFYVAYLNQQLTSSIRLLTEALRKVFNFLPGRLVNSPVFAINELLRQGKITLTPTFVDSL